MLSFSYLVVFGVNTTEGGKVTLGGWIFFCGCVIQWLYHELKTRGNGDDTDDYYRNIERLENNKFMLNMKTFHYNLNHNYQQLLNFINSKQFDVFILGHSCGLSDKTMLKTIFEHNNCRAIKIFHRHKNLKDAESEYFDKSISVSRHFNDNSSYRDKLVPFDINDRVPQQKP